MGEEVEQLLERARSKAEERDWMGVADLLRDALPDFEEEPAVHCWLGVAERELGAPGIAYERFKRALALDPVDPYVLATAGNGIAAFDDPDAERALRTASVTAPDIPLTRLMYGAYLTREGFTEQGLEELRAARELDADDPQVAYELGVAYALAGRLDEAADVLGDAVRLNPEDGWVRVVFGLILLEADRTEEATGELISGARLSEDDVDAQLAAALASAAAGMEDTAYEMIERARLLASRDDVLVLDEVEERVDAGAESSARMLRDDFAPDLLRARLQERP